MKSLVAWAVRNSPGMNALMLAILFLGGLSLVKMRREVFPQFELDIILVTVAYPNAPPDEIEEGICQRIEEKVRTINGIKKITSVASTGNGSVVIELKSDVDDVQKIRGEIESGVAQVQGFFPEDAETPIVQQIDFPRNAIRVAILGPETDWSKRTDLTKEERNLLEAQARMRLRMETEQILSKLLKLEAVSDATIMGAQPFQFYIELKQNKVKKYNLTLEQIAQIVNKSNQDLSAGRINLPGRDELIRGKTRSMDIEKINKIPIIADEKTKAEVLLGEIANVRLGVDDTVDTVSRVDGRPGLIIQINSAENEDLLQTTELVHKFAKDVDLPPGYEMRVWNDISIDVKDRMDLLTTNGLQGLLLVFLVLAIFLELKLAFWVALGIPISIFGAGMILFGTGQTMNMLSMFAFLMALGIVVDDAIVIGENIYAHRQMGKNFHQAAIDGAYEVFPSVFASVTTTIIAFAPMLFVVGVMGKFIAVMPVAVIAMLFISLIESVLILPGHLAHKRTIFDVLVEAIFFPFKFVVWVFNHVNRAAKSGLDYFIQKAYRPTIRFALAYPPIILSAAVATLIASAALVYSGKVSFVFFPKLDAREIQGTVVFRDGTSSEAAKEATRKMEQAIYMVSKDLEAEGYGPDVVRLVNRSVGSALMMGPRGMTATGGSHVGSLIVELSDPEKRDIKSQQIVARWREKAKSLGIEGADTLTFATRSFGPAGAPIELKLLADKEHYEELQRAVEACKKELLTYEGVFDVEDDNRLGKSETRIELTDHAKRENIQLMDVVRAMRNAFTGREVDRLQMGRNEVKRVVALHPDARKSEKDFEDFVFVDSTGVKRPLEEIITRKTAVGDSEINRINQQRSITVTADVDESKGNTQVIVGKFKADRLPKLLEKFPNVRVRWEGQQEQQKESIGSLILGLGVALLSMMMLLMLQFRSWLQPLIIFAVIPFGFIGAMFGHVIMGLDLTLFSLFGLVALTGVVVNDSIVLIDFINARVREGVPVRQALLESGERRFRPVLLTSVTTIAGLLPILAETSFQAQILIPMATSLCFGLLIATVLVLVLIPTLYLVYHRLTTAIEGALLDPEEDDLNGDGATRPVEKPSDGFYEPGTSS